MSRNTTLIKNTSFVIVGNIGSKLMGFIMLPLYTKWMSPDEFGITDIISTYAMLLLNVIAFDISDAIFVFPVGAKENEIKKYYTSGFLFQVFCCLMYAIIFTGISHISLPNSFFLYTWLIYGVLISALFQKYTQDFCRGIKKMSVFSFTGIIQSLSMAGFSIWLIPQFGLKGFVWATILSNIITTLFTILYSKSYKYFALNSFDMHCLKEMLKYSFPLIPTSLMWWLISSLNRPLLEEYCGIFAVGLFAVANKLPSLINMIFGFFQQAWVVTVLEEYKKKDFSTYYNKMFRLVFSIQVLGCIIVMLFAKLFITIMTTKEYEEAWLYIPLLSLSVLFSNTSAFCGTIFTAYRKSKYIFYSVIVGGIVAVIANFLLIPSYKIWGTCIAICISHACSTISRILLSSNIVRFENTYYVIKQLIVFAICFMGIMTNQIVIKHTFIALSLIIFIATNKDTAKMLIKFAKKQK